MHVDVSGVCCSLSLDMILLPCNIDGKSCIVVGGGDKALCGGSDAIAKVAGKDTKPTLARENAGPFHWITMVQP